MVVPDGTPVPRVESVDDFRSALLAAKVLVYANPAGGGAAGVHVARVIQDLGLADALRARTHYGAGGDVTEVTIDQGVGTLGITQISEIVGKSGAGFVGPVPRRLQNYTVCAGGIPPAARNADAVKAFVQALKTPFALRTIQAKVCRPTEA